MLALNTERADGALQHPDLVTQGQFNRGIGKSSDISGDNFTISRSKTFFEA